MEDVERLTRLAAELPEMEVTAHGRHTAFSVRGKKFAYHVVDEHGDGRVAFIGKAGPGENEAMVASDPARYFLPKYMAHHGWVGVHLDVAAVDWDEIGELLVEAYVLIAPKRLTATVRRPPG